MVYFYIGQRNNEQKHKIAAGTQAKISHGYTANIRQAGI